MDLLNPTWESIRENKSSYLFFNKIYDHKSFRGLSTQLVLTYNEHYFVYVRNDRRYYGSFLIDGRSCHIRSLRISDITGLIRGYRDYDKTVYYLKTLGVRPNIHIIDAVIKTIEYSHYMGNINDIELDRYTSIMEAQRRS